MIHLTFLNRSNSLYVKDIRFLQYFAVGPDNVSDEGGKAVAQSSDKLSIGRAFMNVENRFCFTGEQSGDTQEIHVYFHISPFDSLNNKLK